jgi:hypothetical protein
MIILERKPNDRCRCGSEKKFKKCCMGIEYDDFKEIMLIDDNFPDEAYKDGREALDEGDERFMFFPSYFITHPEEKFSEEQQLEIGEQLLICKQKYPHNPVIVNTLYHFHLVRKEIEKALYYVDEMQHHFPRYVLGKVICAQHALDKNRVDEALDHLKKSNTLNEFDPSRRVFQVGEAAAFHAMLVECYVRKGDEAQVVRHYKNLTKAVSMSSGSHYDTYVRAARESVQTWNRIFVDVYREMVRERLREQIFGKPTESETLVE